MAITGNLRTMQLSELLQWLSMGQKTGTLLVHGRPGEKRIYFDQGRIVSSSSTIEREYLGHFLVAHGYITEEELTRAMEVQEESKILLGKILVMIGAISEEDLAVILRLKAAETIYDIFLWTEGAFEFVDGNLPKLPMVPISVDVTGLVMEGLRRFDEWARIRTRIGSHREIPAIVAPIDLDALSERERLVLKTIDGVRSIDEIGELSHNSEFFIATFLFHLLEAGQANIVGVRPRAADSVEMPSGMNELLVFEEAQEVPVGSDLSADSEFSLPLLPPPLVAAKVTPEAPSAPPGGPLQADSSSSSKTRPGDLARFLRRPDSSSAIDRKRRDPGESSSFKGLIDPSSPLRPEASELPPAEEVPPTEVPRIRQAAVPVLNHPMEELVGYSFTPNEAFILSRVNGLWDVRSIAKISPFTETEVLRVFQKLEDGGVISWR
jgi:Domain of unknown function (DUF4388)